MDAVDDVVLPLLAQHKMELRPLNRLLSEPLHLQGVMQIA
jgi:hypothetical protein